MVEASPNCMQDFCSGRRLPLDDSQVTRLIRVYLKWFLYDFFGGVGAHYKNLGHPLYNLNLH